uniref:Uncharacterized protein n=1 Tax=Eutreptiella gymnastica TaxID=73025 RepID=A0A7S1NU68_9EUGL|mmetsp:Transcript_90404/g.156596  ORF Transcript_90404/g.156596 Transcript_90404/m.156596 type:complete len:120 (+) Transcript_90404:187-546(+)
MLEWKSSGGANPLAAGALVGVRPWPSPVPGACAGPGAPPPTINCTPVDALTSLWEHVSSSQPHGALSTTTVAPPSTFPPPHTTPHGGAPELIGVHPPIRPFIQAHARTPEAKNPTGRVR